MSIGLAGDVDGGGEKAVEAFVDHDPGRALRLFLLGGFRAERDGKAIQESAWQRPRARALVKLLATEPSHRLHREQLQDLFWPDLDADAAANSFRKALHQARHAIEPELPPRGTSSYLHLTDDVVILVAERIWVDADSFQALATAALASGDVRPLELALAAYHGELLPEDRYEDWAVARRDALAALQQSLLIRLAEVLERQGAYQGAIERLQQLVALDPAREETHRHLMRLLAISGKRHQALRQYQACRDLLHRHLEAEPEPATEALYQEILAGRVAVDGPGPVAGEQGTAQAWPAALRHLPATALIGRDEALAVLRAGLERARAGTGEMVLVGGEAGVGKTRLTAEVAREAGRRGALVLWGASAELGERLPYSPFVAALDGYLAGRPAAERQAVSAAHPGLASLVPSLAPGADPGDGQHDERSRLFASVARLLDDLAGERTLLLALDDLHTTDAASLQLLHYLARAAAARRWLILGTYREEDVEQAGDFERLCAAATRSGLCRRIDLLPLARAACDQLVQELLPGGVPAPGLLESVYTHSLGNPLFVQELVRALQEHGDLQFVDGRWQALADGAGVPRQVRELIETRVDRLGDEVRRTLALAAVAGLEIPFVVLRAASDVAEATLLDALDRALVARIVVERGDGYAFRHPLFRAALHERLSQPRRAALHAALANAFEQQPGSGAAPRPEVVEALAHHWEQAGQPLRAVPYLIRAGEWAAEVYANGEALSRFRHALALIDAAGSEASLQRAEVQERIGDLYALTGEHGPARQAYAQALASGRFEALAAARVGRKAAHQVLLQGDLAAAQDLLDVAAAQVQGTEASPARTLERMRLLATRAQRAWLAHRFEEALAAAEESARLAEAMNAHADRARAYEMMALACLPLGQWQRGAEYERRRESLADLDRDIVDTADVHL